MSKEIKKGDLFVCIKTVKMNELNKPIRYRKGFVYKSEEKECITNDNHETDHSWTKYGKDTKKYFLRIKTN